MRTLGVDLASQPRNTAICSVVWRARSAQVEKIVCPADDQTILAACESGDACGIDAPFGWPEAFVALLARDERSAASWDDARRDELRLRLTDRVAHARVGRQPLSVSADRIALAALRCRSILRRLNVSDRSGANGVFEVWPAGFRVAVGWIAHKKTARVDAIGDLRRIRTALPWLQISGDVEALCVTKGALDNAVDALVAALAARAAALGNTDVPAEEQRASASSEGWIHLPRRGLALHELLGVSP